MHRSDSYTLNPTPLRAAQFFHVAFTFHDRARIHHSAQLVRRKNDESYCGHWSAQNLARAPRENGTHCVPVPLDPNPASKFFRHSDINSGVTFRCDWRALCFSYALSPPATAKLR